MVQSLTSDRPQSAPHASLAGRSAIVTGSTSGIGLGIARAFSAAGMNVMLNGFGNAADIERTRHDLESTFGTKIAYSAADMSMPGDIANMVETAKKAFGAVDIIVNNAGIQHVEAIETFPPAKWDQIIAINLSAAFHATRAAVPGMKARNWGRVINISSNSARAVVPPTGVAYVASKHGIIGLTPHDGV